MFFPSKVSSELSHTGSRFLLPCGSLFPQGFGVLPLGSSRQRGLEVPRPPLLTGHRPVPRHTSPKCPGGWEIWPVCSGNLGASALVPSWRAWAVGGQWADGLLVIETKVLHLWNWNPNPHTRRGPVPGLCIQGAQRPGLHGRMPTPHGPPTGEAQLSLLPEAKCRQPNSA